MSKIKIIMPMAGAGTRFGKLSITKPLIPTNSSGEPMWRTSAECFLLPNCEFVFVIRKQDEKLLRNDLEKWNGGSKVVTVLRLTDGPLSTVLEAEPLIEYNPLVVANCDQFVDWSKAQLAAFFSTLEKNDGVIVTMNVKEQSRRWSYVKRHENNVMLLSEKVPISDEATLGIYGFRNGREFLKYAFQMVMSDLRVRGEFYVGPVYNGMISDGKKIAAFNLTERRIAWCGLGTPDDLEKFKQGEY